MTDGFSLPFYWEPVPRGVCRNAQFAQKPARKKKTKPKILLQSSAGDAGGGAPSAPAAPAHLPTPFKKGAGFHVPEVPTFEQMHLHDGNLSASSGYGEEELQRSFSLVKGWLKALGEVENPTLCLVSFCETPGHEQPARGTTARPEPNSTFRVTYFLQVFTKGLNSGLSVMR